MPRKINLFIFLRILIGTLLIVSGFEKLISPYQNFLYVIQSYNFLPFGIQELCARILPWIEFFLGVFLTLGFWLRFVLFGVGGMFSIFIFVVTQAIVRYLPINECGCFGDLISFPLPVIVIFDTLALIVIVSLYRHVKETSRFGLDQYISSNDRI